jgi:hypothetical protein
MIFARKPYAGDEYWKDRTMRPDENMTDVEGGMARLVDDIHRERDRINRTLEVPATPDLFADGLEIAQAVLDWEERAGQPIAPLIEHIKAAQELRKTISSNAESKGEASS